MRVWTYNVRSFFQVKQKVHEWIVLVGVGTGRNEEVLSLFLVRVYLTKIRHSVQYVSWLCSTALMQIFIASHRLQNGSDQQWERWDWTIRDLRIGRLRSNRISNRIKRDVRNYRLIIPILKHITMPAYDHSLIELASLYTVPLSAVNGLSRLTTTSNGHAQPIRKFSNRPTTF